MRLEVLDQPDAAAMIDAAPALTFRVNRRRGATEPGAFPQAEAETTPGASASAPSLDFPQLHTEGCGDFQMLHRDDWRALRGYAELDAFIYSLYADLLAGRVGPEYLEQVLEAARLYAATTLEFCGSA